jgi:hypothetical protein
MSPIPKITNPMGRNWRQPPREAIEIDETHALMSKSTLEQLGNYSASMPSGVYPGKMWRRAKDYHDESKGWWLLWFGESDIPGYVSNHCREILIA